MSLHQQTVATVFLGLSHVTKIPLGLYSTYEETAVGWLLFIFVFLTVSVLLNVLSLMVFKDAVGPTTEGFC